MLSNDLVNAFDDCINRLAAGQSLEDCLRAHPQYAADLEPMLLAGQLAVHARPIAVEVDVAKNRQRARFEQALQTTSIHKFSQRRMTFSRVAAIAASLILIIGVLLGGAAAYAQGSLPGDRLYGLKLALEDGRLWVASLVGDKENLESTFAQNRIDETQDLLALGREETVEFEGEIVSKQVTADGFNIGVDELTIVVSADNDRIPDYEELSIGDRIRIEGRTTRNRELIATTIRVIDRRIEENDRPNSPSPTPIINIEPSATSTLTPTIRPSPTPTRQLDSINDQTPIPTLEPTRPIDIPPTARPPTQVPPPEPTRANEGDGGNDGGSDSGGNDGGDGRR